MSAWSEASLFAAARAELAERVIRPALARGAVVVSDRYLDSSLAYQGAARGLGIDRVLELNAAVEDLMPDRTFVLLVDEATAASGSGGARRTGSSAKALPSARRCRRASAPSPSGFRSGSCSSTAGSPATRLLQGSGKIVGGESMRIEMVRTGDRSFTEIGGRWAKLGNGGRLVLDWPPHARV